ncbi:MAG: hypothetical protein WC527_01175 [Candidatus Margulisiibacteriota bacterium]
MARKGSLLFTFIILVAVSAVLFSFLYVVIARSRDIPAKKASTKAFYIAESGINKAIWYLITSTEAGGKGEAWRTAGTSESFADGAYTISVLDGPSAGSILIIATGEVNGITRTIQQILSGGSSSTASFDYAVYANSTLNLTGAGGITGPVFGKGNITLTGATSINGAVTIMSGSTYKKNGVDQPATVTTTQPPMPEIDTTYYDALLAQAALQPAGNMSITGAGTYNLAGGTLYVNGNLTVSGARRIAGGGTIVVTGSYSQSGAGNIDSNTKIITGNNLTISGSNVVNSGGLLFARNDITLSGAGDITGSVIAMNSVNASGAGRTIGLVYAQAGMSGARTIVGSVVCRTAATFSGAINITYDRTKIPASIPGVFSKGGLAKEKGGWKEKK